MRGCFFSVQSTDASELTQSTKEMEPDSAVRGQNFPLQLAGASPKSCTIQPHITQASEIKIRPPGHSLPETPKLRKGAACGRGAALKFALSRRRRCSHSDSPVPPTRAARGGKPRMGEMCHRHRATRMFCISKTRSRVRCFPLAPVFPGLPLFGRRRKSDRIKGIFSAT